MGEVVTSRAFSFFHFSCLNARTAYPENHGFAINAPNDVFTCRLVYYEVIFPKRRDQGSVTYFLNFGITSVTFERVKLDTSFFR